ncbi:MAG: branched-chain amino acid ABC transporter permease [Chthonomonadales bacterium]|nr:branched-chain amino acid ABC transporter permease [Chthonomonadales bacterium]
MRWLAGKVVSALAVLATLSVASTLLTRYMDTYYFVVLIQCGIAITLAVSLNLINGITGQFSIGHAGFYAIGAYVGAAWTVLWRPALVGLFPVLEIGTLSGDALNLCLAVVLGAVAAGIAGFVVGLPSLRLRGDYLAILTLGFGEVIRVVLLNLDSVGGARGLSGIPTLVSAHELAVFWVFLLVVAVVALSRNLMRTVRGLTWLAVREDEIAAEAMGVGTTSVKVTAFIIGSGFAGAAGVLYAHYFTGISPDVFGMDVSIIITTMVVLGGSGSVTGSILAASLLTATPELLRGLVPMLKDYRLVIFSTMLVVVMLTRPQGLFGHGEIGYATARGLLRRLRRAPSSAGG